MVSGGGKGSGAREVSRKSVRMAGRDATEVVYELPKGTGSSKPQLVARFLVTSSNAYILIIGSEKGRPKAADEKGFFDSFELVTGSSSAKK
jgi:hypothetical protein